MQCPFVQSHPQGFCVWAFAAHPPSTQSDGNGKPVCIHHLPASFVCAVKTIFLHRTNDQKCKKKWVLELNRFVGFL